MGEDCLVKDEMTRRELGRAAIAGAAFVGLGGFATACGGSDGGQDILDGLPESKVPRPVDYLRTNWSRDPLARCSYSYLAATPYGSGVRAMLAEPFERVAFAGEATSRIDPATVHGAIEAGRTAAGRAVDELPGGARVAVIGAGACGLACAGELTSAGLEPLLLESSDRVGGRVRSGELAGSDVELGASWIHGRQGNPLTGLAEENEVPIRDFHYQLDFPVPGQQRLAVEGERRFRESIGAFDPGIPGARQMTVDDLLPRRRGPGLDWTLQFEIAQEYGADPGQLAALATWEGGWFGGGDALVGGPYTKLIEGLSRGSEIRHGFHVDRVSQDAGRVTISAAGEDVEAEAAIVTVPIGVLKAGSIDFSPGLPDRITFAIRSLGAGLFDKLWLAFEEPFWDQETEGFQWIDPALPGRWGAWVNWVPVTGRPFLLTFTGGSDARRIAGWEDREVLASAIGALDRIFAS